MWLRGAESGGGGTRGGEGLGCLEKEFVLWVVRHQGGDFRPGGGHSLLS